MADKPLVIDVKEGASLPGALNEWKLFENTEVFIKAIRTPELDKKTNIGTLVSGIPSAFARVDLFRTALEHVANNSKPSPTAPLSLVNYYFLLAEEWRGLIACMALDHVHIEARRINLDYTDGKSVKDTANVYEPKGAFGNMLLERSDVWSVGNPAPTIQGVRTPYINVIKYHKVVVGATSPESLLFTSTGYDLEEYKSHPWIDPVSGRFVDPTNLGLTGEQLANLYAYVSHLCDGMSQFTTSYTDVVPTYRNIVRAELSRWRDELERRAKSDNVDLRKGCIPPVNADFAGPFKDLFCYKDELWGWEGEIYGSDPGNSRLIKFDPQDLLLSDVDPKNTSKERARIAKIDLNVNKQDMENLPMVVLTAKQIGSDEPAYFALPLSALGLNVFGKTVAQLVRMPGYNQTENYNCKLEAIYDPSLREENLEVILQIRTINGVERTFKKLYTSDSTISNKDILLWPNFVSKQWNQYYMYSELPHNANTQDYKAIPLAGEIYEKSFRIMLDEKNKPILLSENGSITKQASDPTLGINAKLLIESNDRVSDNSYKYEIYSSNKPFKGVKLLSPIGYEGGYLLANYTDSPNRQSLPKIISDVNQIEEVCLGIDFGSTNTSIAISNGSAEFPNKEKHYKFTNQRVSLMGYDLGNTRGVARENHVLFFQGALGDVEWNSIKSTLTLHDARRFGSSNDIELPVVGGFPCFADNLPLSNSNERNIYLNFPSIGEVTQVHNMKWEEDKNSIAHKTAFLSGLLLHVYATLFADQSNGVTRCPTTLKWSYPSSMSQGLIGKYSDIWRKLGSTKHPSPILDGEYNPIKLEIFDADGFGGFNGGVEDGWNSSNSGSDGWGDSSSNSSNEWGTSNEWGGSSNNNSNEWGTSNEWGGSSSNNSSDWGASSDWGGSSNSTPKPNSRAGLKADDPNAKIAYKPTKTSDNPKRSLSEAEAVANFIVTPVEGRTSSSGGDFITLSFDVGGSTTDISALCYLEGNKYTMIKQNSLRFAAQRVSKCVGNFPEFRNLLDNVCGANGFKILGFNQGPKAYNASTASYFFDQIVNRLQPEQLPDFYRKIAATCPKLLCVNMYVTGLLMYYAGQISRKLVNDLKNSDEYKINGAPFINVTFAGKGSRLFQWLAANNSRASEQYYKTLFIKGYGEDAIFTSTRGMKINIPDMNDPNIKFEVSKGLAKKVSDNNPRGELYKPSVEQPSEILGETGFMLGSEALDFTNSITPAMMKAIGFDFAVDSSKKQAEKFMDFCKFFYTAASSITGWKTNVNEMARACNEMQIVDYIKGMPEYRQAEQDMDNFDFYAPIIIIEGMKFYDQTLLNLMK